MSLGDGVQYVVRITQVTRGGGMPPQTIPGQRIFRVRFFIFRGLFTSETLNSVSKAVVKNSYLLKKSSKNELLQFCLKWSFVWDLNGMRFVWLLISVTMKSLIEA